MKAKQKNVPKEVKVSIDQFQEYQSLMEKMKKKLDPKVYRPK